MAWRRGSIHWSRTDGGLGREAVVLVLGGVARLNDAAATVWEQIEEARDREILIRRLRRRYHRVEDRTLRGDLDLLLDRWQRDRWIEWQDDPVFPFPEEPWPL